MYNIHISPKIFPDTTAKGPSKQIDNHCHSLLASPLCGQSNRRCKDADKRESSDDNCPYRFKTLPPISSETLIEANKIAKP